MVLFDFLRFAVLKLQMISNFRYGSLRLHSGNINSLFLNQQLVRIFIMMLLSINLNISWSLQPSGVAWFEVIDLLSNVVANCSRLKHQLFFGIFHHSSLFVVLKCYCNCFFKAIFLPASYSDVVLYQQENLIIIVEAWRKSILTQIRRNKNCTTLLNVSYEHFFWSFNTFQKDFDERRTMNESKRYEKPKLWVLCTHLFAIDFMLKKWSIVLLLLINITTLITLFDILKEINTLIPFQELLQLIGHSLCLAPDQTSFLLNLELII